MLLYVSFLFFCVPHFFSLLSSHWLLFLMLSLSLCIFLSSVSKFSFFLCVLSFSLWWIFPLPLTCSCFCSFPLLLAPSHLCFLVFVLFLTIYCCPSLIFPFFLSFPFIFLIPFPIPCPSYSPCFALLSVFNCLVPLPPFTSLSNCLCLWLTCHFITENFLLSCVHSHACGFLFVLCSLFHSRLLTSSLSCLLSPELSISLRHVFPLFLDMLCHSIGRTFPLSGKLSCLIVLFFSVLFSSSPWCTPTH